MADVIKAFTPANGLDTGISMISTEDWIRLTTFFSSAITDSPDTEKKMRAKLSMRDTDEFTNEFKETVTLFDGLVKIAKEFKYTVVEEVLSLADDIVHYESKASSIYQRLAELVSRFDLPGVGDTPEELQKKMNALIASWKQGVVTGNSDKIEARFKLALEDLIQEADARARRADALREKILGPQGLHQRLEQSKTDFDRKETAFKAKYGTESASVIQLRSELAALQNELNALRKKDSDEVIVLATSPVYLIIPGLGPLILIGVDIGVGVDLAKTREKIGTLQDKATLKSKEIDRNEHFITYYDSGKTMVAEMSERIKDICPRLQTLGLGWRAIANDLKYIVDLLGVDGRDKIRQEDWFNFVTVLDTARNTWRLVATKADQLRSVAQPVPANDVNDAFAKLKLVA